MLCLGSLPVTPFTHVLGMVAAYLTLAELIKQRFFYGRCGGALRVAVSGNEWERRIHRRAFRWSSGEALPSRPA